MRSEKLFTYGTLQDPATQQHVIGRSFGAGRPDTLRGYRLAKLLGIHEQYRILQPHRGSTVAGLLFEVTQAELEQIDAYEGDAYQRVSVTLVSKTRAWVYCANPRSSLRSRIVVEDSP